MDWWRTLLSSSILLVLSFPIQVQEVSDSSDFRTLRAFVQDFYDWYLPKTVTDESGPAWITAVKSRPSAFDPQLARLLEEDSDAQDRAKGEIVGLDFDPFLASQHPCDRYEVGTVQSKGSHYLVDIYSVCRGQKSKKPDVIAVLSRNADHWTFANFLYENNGSLLRILNSLREQRQQH